MSLHEELTQCERDTRQIIGAGAAKRLACWQRYPTEAELVQFIQRTIRNDRNNANGFELEQNKKLSLESIVLANPDLFTEDDIRISTQILNRD